MTRTIKTKYYVGSARNVPVQVNSSTDANGAVAKCVLHMQINHYRGATLAEVYDDASGQLHAQVRRSPATGKITIDYQRNPEKYEVRMAVGALFDKPKKRK